MNIIGAWFTRYRLFRVCGFGYGYSVARSFHVPIRIARRMDSRMHGTWFGVIIIGMVMAWGMACNGSPIGPERVMAETETIREIVIPLWHGMPASMPDGSVVTVCATQPRTYGHPDGSRTTETDAYIVMHGAQCPTIPID
jgi:hypothetical protein